MYIRGHLPGQLNRSDLWPSCHPMNVSIGWILKLLQDVGVLCLGSNLLCLCHSTLHSLQRRYWHEGVPVSCVST